ncbi:MAG: hypothetical protein MUO84_04570, partial [Thermoplasmata archaeon]|nr:hypothetical protein [Thermoplasmata archaeon]
MHISGNATPALASESGSIAIMAAQGRKSVAPESSKAICASHQYSATRTHATVAQLEEQLT